MMLGTHKTSITLEDEFWTVIKNIAAEHETSVGSLIAAISENDHAGNLSSAIRVFAVEYMHERAITGSADRVMARIAPKLAA